MSSKLILIDLVLSLSTGRWGAWIGLPNLGIFLIDVILLIAFICAWLEGQLDLFPKVAIVIVFILLQFSRNPTTDFVLRIRDLLPFIYLAIFGMLRKSIKDIPRSSLMHCLRIATAISFIWNVSVSIGLLKPFMLNPISGIEIFSQRPDHAGVVAGIGCLVWGSSWGYPKGIKFSFPMVVFPYLFLVQTLLTTGRAGLLAVLLCFFFIIFFEGSALISKRKRAFFFTIVALTIAITPAIIQILPENSAIARFGVVAKNEVAARGGSGTASARKFAAGLVLAWTRENKHVLVGAGPGYEILIESGAVKWLSGSLDVRYPHNWWISIYSRFGLVGSVLWIWILLNFWSQGSSLRHYKTPIILAILVVASLGVIIESPFGLWPLYFFIFR